MKKFKLNVDTEKVDIVKLLNEYSSSLSLDSGGILSGLIETQIINNKIIYEFKIKNIINQLGVLFLNIKTINYGKKIQ
jgi:hypothetical protein